MGLDSGRDGANCPWCGRVRLEYRRFVEPREPVPPIPLKRMRPVGANPGISTLVYGEPSGPVQERGRSDDSRKAACPFGSPVKTWMPDADGATLAALAKRPALSVHDLEAQVGRSVVFQIKRKEGAIEVVAGRLTDVNPGPPVVRLRLDSLDPRAAQRFLGELALPNQGELLLRPGDGVVAMHPLLNADGLLGACRPEGRGPGSGVGPPRPVRSRSLSG